MEGRNPLVISNSEKPGTAGEKKTRRKIAVRRGDMQQRQEQRSEWAVKGNRTGERKLPARKENGYKRHERKGDEVRGEAKEAGKRG